MYFPEKQYSRLSTCKAYLSGLVLVSTMTVLTACGGGSTGKGLVVDAPTVSVTGLEPTLGHSVIVSLNSDEELVFQQNGTQKFETIVVNGGRYTVAVEGTGGDIVCRLGDGFAVTSKEAGQTFTVVCAVPSEDDGDLNAEGLQMSVALVDFLGQPAGTVDNPVSATREGRLRITLREDGVPLVREIVSVTTQFTSLDPLAGTALTDGRGVAEVVLRSTEMSGADVVTVIYTGEEDTITRTLNYLTIGTESSPPAVSEQVDIGRGLDEDFEIGVLALSQASVSAGSTLLVTANLSAVETVEQQGQDPIEERSTFTGVVPLTFTSECVAAGTAVIDTPVNSSAGSAVATYRPFTGCIQDRVRASARLNGIEKVALSEAITIIPAAPNAIEFVGAEPAIIGLRGSSQAGTPEVAVLTFLIKDSNGDTVGPGVEVDFEPVVETGNFVIVSGSRTSTTQEGMASVTVRSGSVAGVAGVRAELVSDDSANAIGTVSIQAGVPSQDRFRLAAQVVNPRAGSWLGTEVPITVRVGDRFGNWVPDGYRVNFTSELGDMDASCAVQDGTCQVTWVSVGQQSIHFDSGREGRSCRPVGPDADKRGVQPFRCSIPDRYGRNTIMAWGIGEESFVDRDGTNQFDASDEWIAMTDAFRDDNETGKYEDTGPYSEIFIDHAKNGLFEDAGSLFRGVGCASAAEAAGHCKRLTSVRDSLVMVMSTDSVHMWLYDTHPGTLNWPEPTRWADPAIATAQGPSASQLKQPLNILENHTVYLLISDLNGNAPVAGTTITVSGDMVAVGPSSCTVPSTTEAYVCVFRVAPPQVIPLNPSPQIFSAEAPSGLVQSVAISVFRP